MRASGLALPGFLRSFSSFMLPARLPRAFVWFAGATAVILAVMGVVLFRAGLQEKREAPAGYFIPAEPDMRVKIGWRSRAVATVLPLRSGQILHLADEQHGWLVAQNGSVEELKGPAQRILQAGIHPDLDHLHPSLLQLAGSTPAVSRPDPGSVLVVTSPVGVTRYRDPEIRWSARPGVLYDVAVVDPADPDAPPRLARGVEPPIRLSALKSTQRPELPVDRIFAVVVREAGPDGAVGINRFLTHRDATADEPPADPALQVVEAARAMSQRPFRAGDAWQALSTLPPSWQSNELVVRLRLKIAAELGFQEEVNRILAELKQPR